MILFHTELFWVSFRLPSQSFKIVFIASPHVFYLPAQNHVFLLFSLLLKILFRNIVKWNQIIPDNEKSVLETSEYPGVHSLPSGVHSCTMFGYTDLSITSRSKGVRELVKVSLKLPKSDCSVLFNRVCLSVNILAKYTNINRH